MLALLAEKPEPGAEKRERLAALVRAAPTRA
jgi:hypothetical protein